MNTNVLVIVMAVVVAFVGTAQTHAALTFTGEFSTDNELAFADDVRDNDLIDVNGTDLRISSTVVTGYNPFQWPDQLPCSTPGDPDYALNNGIFGGSTTDSNSMANGNASFELELYGEPAVGPYTVTYTLDVTTQTEGYDIARVRSYAANTGGARGGQAYEMLVDYVGGGVDFVSLGSAFVESWGCTSSQVTWVDDTTPGSPFVTGVEAIQFAIVPGADVHDTLGDYPLGDVWREIDVEAVIPEPSVIVMLAAGLIGFLAMRRRMF